MDQLQAIAFGLIDTVESRAADLKARPTFWEGPLLWLSVVTTASLSSKQHVVVKEEEEEERRCYYGSKRGQWKSEEEEGSLGLRLRNAWWKSDTPCLSGATDTGHFPD